MILRRAKTVLKILAIAAVAAFLAGLGASFAFRPPPLRPQSAPAPNDSQAADVPDRPVPRPEAVAVQPPLRKPIRILGDRRFLAPDRITAVAVSPDGKILATGLQSFPSPDPVLLFDAATGEEIGRLKGHERLINRMAFSPDGATLYTGANSATPTLSYPDNFLRVWDVPARKEISRLQAHDWALTPDGRILVTLQALNGGNHWPGRPVPSRFIVDVWDTRTWEQLWTHFELGCKMASVAITPDGRNIACGGMDGTVRLWDRTSGKELPKLTGLKESVYLLAFSPDGKTLAAASEWAFSRNEPHPVVLWDWLSGKEIHRLSTYKEVILTLSFTPDGKYLLTGGRDGACRVWDTVAGTEGARLNSGDWGFVTHLSLSADGQRVYVADQKCQPRVVDFASRKEVPLDPPFGPVPVPLPFETADPLPGPHDFNADIRLPDGTVLHNGLWDNDPGVRRIDPVSGKMIREFVPGWAVDFGCTPDGKTLATFGHDARGRGGDTAVHLWDVETGQNLGPIADDPRPDMSFRFSPDGTQFVVQHRDGIVRLWDVASRKPLLRLDPDGWPVSFLVFSKDGRFFVSGSSISPIVLVWDVTLPGRRE